MMILRKKKKILKPRWEIEYIKLVQTFQGKPPANIVLFMQSTRKIHFAKSHHRTAQRKKKKTFFPLSHLNE